jgi:hypothetical protein
MRAMISPMLKFSTLALLTLLFGTVLGCPDENTPDGSEEPCAMNGSCGPNEVCQEIAGQETCICDNGFTDCDGVCIGINETCGSDNNMIDAGTSEPPTTNDAGTTPPPQATDGGTDIMPGECAPGNRICQGPSVYGCNAGGTAYEFVELCMDDCVNGACTSPCGDETDKVSYLGCTFWATRLENDNSSADFSLTISSHGNLPIEATITTADGTAVETATVQPGGLTSVTLNTLGQIEGTGISRNAYRLSTNGKVTIHQFNPVNDASIHSSDATLLLPVSALGQQYRFIGWPTEFVSIQAGFLPATCTTDDDCGGDPFICGDTGTCRILTIFTSKMSLIATGEDSTALTINAPVDVEIADSSGASTIYPASQGFELNLTQGDVLTLSTTEVDEADLSGMTVTSDKKVAVFSTNTCAMVPHGTFACDHIEQQLFPSPTWGKEYVAAKFKPRGTEPDFWRIVANADNTTFTTTPVIPELENLTLNAGDIIQFYNTDSFHLLATAPVSVAQFMVGSDYPGPSGGCGADFTESFPPQAAADRTNCDIPLNPSCSQGIGDPAFLLNVPASQYRQDYTVLVPNDYAENYVGLILPEGAIATVDGVVLVEDVSISQALSSTGWRVVTQSLASGVHKVTADQAFGLISYGYDCTVSYAYPGGLNLEASQ